ncbi:hypothetical protein Btru_009405 [Bulinus truncatus]|nr:hypothetical protein Btru_009405 [Bulinus truncatus]
MLYLTNTFIASAIIKLSFGNWQECSSFAMEGISYTHAAVFKFISNGPLELLWTRNGLSLSKCTLVDGCIDYWEDKTSTSMTLLSDGTCQSYLTIKNVTEKDCGLWKLNYLGPAVMEHPENLYTCTLKLEDTQHNHNYIETKGKDVLAITDSVESESSRWVVIIPLILSICPFAFIVYCILSKSAGVQKIFKQQKHINKDLNIIEISTVFIITGGMSYLKNVDTNEIK